MKRRNFIGGTIASASALLPSILRSRQEEPADPTLPKWVYSAYGRDENWISLSDMDWDELAVSCKLMHHHFKPTMDCWRCLGEFDQFGRFLNPKGSRIFLRTTEETIEDACKKFFGREDTDPMRPLVHQLWHWWDDMHGVWEITRTEAVMDRAILS